MRVLFLTPALPDLDADTESRATQTLRYLSREHEVTILAFARDRRDHARRFALEAICHRVELVEHPLALVARRIGVSTGSQRSARRLAGGRDPRLTARRLIETERIDLIHVDRPAMAACVPAAWQGPVVLDERGATWRSAQSHADRAGNPASRWLLRRAARERRAGEAVICRRAMVTLASSERERHAIELAVGTPWAVHVVPIGLDVSRWDAGWQDRERDPRRLFTAGALTARSGQEGVAWFLREVWPLVRSAHADAEYAAAGLGTLMRGRLARQPGVRVHERSDADTLWADAGIFVAPWRSEGPRREVLRALAAGIPLVATPAACEGLEVAHGEHALLAETPEAFAQALARLMAEPQLARLLALRGHRLVRDHYDTPLARAALDSAYEHVLTGVSRCVLCS